MDNFCYPKFRIRADYHYKKYANPKDRKQIDKVPEGVDLATYFDYANVDPKNHYFKKEWVMPWLEKILK